MAKKTPKKTDKKIDVEHDFEDIVSMMLFNYDIPDDTPKPEPKFKIGDKVKLIPDNGYIYTIEKINGTFEFEYIIINILPHEQVKSPDRKKLVKENEIEKAP